MALVTIVALATSGFQSRDVDTAQRKGKSRFGLAVESSMQKVFLEAKGQKLEAIDRCQLELARNEHESVQVVVVPFAESLQNVTWRLSELRGPGGATIPGTVRLVGYVDCKKPSYRVSKTGWWPDPLIDFQTSVPLVPLGEVMPLWVTVEALEDTPAGIYSGRLTVFARDAAPKTVDLTIEVWDFDLPEHTHLRTALNLRHLPDALYPAKKLDDMTRKYENWMLEEYHLNPGSIYRDVPKWDDDRLRELVGMGLNGLNLAYFNAPREPDFKADDYWRKFKQKVKEIRAYLPIVEASGARDLCYIYCFDERPEDQLDVVFETAAKLKELWPDIEVMTTAHDTTFGLERPNGDTMDIWVPLTPEFDDNAARIDEARKGARDCWWYICIKPQNPYANWFVEYSAIEPRLIMGAMTAKYRPGGFLYYSVNSWSKNDRVITGGPRTDWNPASYEVNNGDGSIICAGPNGPLATIRLENIRDGIEDYEYYLLLRELLSKRGRDPSAGEVSLSVVENLTTYTREPEVLLAERRRVAKAILELSR